MIKEFTMFTDLASLLPSLEDILSKAAVSIAQYVLLSLALFQISRALSLPHPAFAWIPVLQYYRLGQIADLYTDNRMATAEDRASPYYNPSRLRIKIIVSQVAIGATTAAAAIAAFLTLRSTLASISLLFTEEEVYIPELHTATIMIAGLIALAAGLLCLIFAIIYLTAYCPALNRIFIALDAPVPALFTVLAVLFPLVGMILLYIYTHKAQNLAARFAPVPPADSIDFSVDSHTTESDYTP